MANRSGSNDRRARVEELRRDQARAERRKTLGFIAVAALVGLALLAYPLYSAVAGFVNDPARKPLSSYGVPAAAAGCSAIESPPATEAGIHIGPNSDRPEKLAARYSTVPPTSGEHYNLTASLGRKFFAPGAGPRMEELVHNLEHGYTVVWYDDTVRGEQLDALRGLLDKITRESPKFVVTPWDNAYGRFPAGKHVGIAAWGHKQLCGSVSGEVIGAFVTKFPPSQAPEPGGA